MPRPKSLGSYAPLSTSYYRDDAILEAGERAELLYVRGLAYCAESPTDGYISERQLTAVVGIGMKDVGKRATALVGVGLWEKIDGGYVIRSWLKWNKSADAIGRFLKKDRERKATGKRTESVVIPDGIHVDSTDQYTAVQYTRDSAPTERAAKPPAPESPASPKPVVPPPVPTGQTQGQAATEETEGQRVNRLTKVFTDLVPMSKFVAVQGVVRKAVQAAPQGVPLYNDAQIIEALERLAKEGRVVTVDVLRIELDGLPPLAPRQRVGAQSARDQMDIAKRIYERDNPPPTPDQQLALGESA